VITTKSDKNQKFIPIGNSENATIVNETVSDFSMYQNIPNPFNPSTMITDALPKEAPVSLKVYDIIGREVMTLVNEFKSAGRYNVSFDASQLPSGMYIYRIQAGKFSAIKRLDVVK
jgi:hypothetical protein